MGLGCRRRKGRFVLGVSLRVSNRVFNYSKGFTGFWRTGKGVEQRVGLFR